VAGRRLLCPGRRDLNKMRPDMHACTAADKRLPDMLTFSPSVFRCIAKRMYFVTVESGHPCYFLVSVWQFWSQEPFYFNLYKVARSAYS